MVTLYQAEWCPFSSAVREVLTELGLDFVARQVEPWPEQRATLLERSGKDEIPALETEDGELVVGCNVESASYGLTICAERSAIFSAVSRGQKRIKQIAVVTDTDELTAPCGACRQIIWEFGGDIPVIMSNLNGKTETVHMKDLLPKAFDTTFLK